VNHHCDIQQKQAMYSSQKQAMYSSQKQAMYSSQKSLILFTCNFHTFSILLTSINLKRL